MEETTATPAVTQDNTDAPPAIEAAPGLMGVSSNPPEVASETDVKADAEPVKEGAQEEVVTAPDVYETFNVKAGEEFGYKMNEVQHEAFSAQVKDLGLTQEQAQKLVDFDINRQSEFSKTQAEAQETTLKEWETELKTEFGDKYAEQVSIAGKAFDAFASPKLRELLNNTGLNHNPEVVKMFRDMGTKMSEDSFVSGNSTNTKEETFNKLSDIFPQPKVEGR